MMKTHRYGRSTLAQMGGTTTSDIERWYRVAAGRGDPVVALKRSLPLSQLWWDPPEQWAKWMMTEGLDARLTPEEILGMPLIRTRWGLEL